MFIKVCSGLYGNCFNVNRIRALFSTRLAQRLKIKVPECRKRNHKRKHKAKGRNILISCWASINDWNHLHKKAIITELWYNNSLYSKSPSPSPSYAHLLILEYLCISCKTPLDPTNWIQFISLWKLQACIYSISIIFLGHNT